MASGWCPGVRRLVTAGDGLLARVHIPLGRLSLLQASGFAQAAADGPIELTGRGNIQLRSLEPAAVDRLKEQLAALGLLEDEGPGPYRLTVTSPLSGIDSEEEVDALSLAHSLEVASRSMQGLPPKALVAINGAITTYLPFAHADIHVRAVAPGRVALTLAGTPGWYGSWTEAEVRAALNTMLDHWATRTPGQRVRSMTAADRDQLLALLPKRQPLPLPEPDAWPRAGGLGLRNGGSALLVAPPFGRITGNILARIVALVRESGLTQLIVSPTRGFLFGPLSAACAGSLAQEMAALGLITGPDDPRLAIVACAGAPDCARALAPVRQHASLIAAALPARHRYGGADIHLSGCGKGCAGSGTEKITLIAASGGYLWQEQTGKDTTLSSTPLPLAMVAARLERHEADRIASMKQRDPYLRDGAAIYARSFAIIRSEARLTSFSGAAERVVVRMIHASGLIDLAADVAMSSDFADRASACIAAGAPILCDTRMVADGITRARLAAGNRVIVTLGDDEVSALALRQGTTRSAAAVDLWRPWLAGSLVVIGNAPTALFRLLELLDEGQPAPAAVIGVPVGFVGAAESKTALVEDGRIPFLVVHGRRGGSAMAAAVVNALAQAQE